MKFLVRVLARFFPCFIHFLCYILLGNRPNYIIPLKWDCIDRVWKKWYQFRYTPLHNCWGVKWFIPTKRWGEIWLIFLWIPIKYVPVKDYPWNK